MLGLQQFNAGAPACPTKLGAGGEPVPLHAGLCPGSHPALPGCSRERVTSLAVCSIAAAVCHLGLRKQESRGWTIMQVEMEG